MATFDQQQFEVEVAPALKPSHPSRPASTGDAVLDALAEARWLICDRASWFGPKGELHGKFCAALAVAHIAPRYSVKHRAFDYLNRMLPRQYGGLQAIFDFNDRHSHAEVLSLFDRAMAARRKSLPSIFWRFIAKARA